MEKINRVGETKYNKWNNKMTIIRYNNSNDMVVEFENGYKTSTQYNYFKKGNIKSPFCKSVFGIGFEGKGKYFISKDGIHTKEYICWFSMMNRCYNNKLLNIRPTYQDCSVCEEWHNFQNFAQWFNENWYEVDNEKMHLDKDILIKGNKIYSPETCTFVPDSINCLFTKRQNDRGEYPIGVTYHNRDNVFQARCNVNGKSKYLGSYNTPQKAFSQYKIEKEKTIKKTAETYKHKIPLKLYNALLNYEVEYTD